MERSTPVNGMAGSDTGQACPRVGLPAVLAGVVTATVALMAYLPTVAPTITWRHGGADSGELSSAVMVLGAPHPPGYPTYVMVGWLWTALPLGGDLAHRLSLMSAAGAALSAAICAVTIAALGTRAVSSQAVATAAGALAGLAFALAPLTWSQATIAEVYAPGLVVLATLSLLLLVGRPEARLRVGLAAGLVGGLGLGVLPQIVLAGPGALALLGARCGWRQSTRLLAQIFAAGCVGAAIFVYVPVRAAFDPLVNWGDATTPAGFWALVSAESYRPMLGSPAPSQWLGRVMESVLVLGGNLSWIGLGLAAIGVRTLAAGPRGALGYLLGLIGLTITFRAAYPAEGNTVYLLPALYGLALLAGLGVAALLARVRRGGPVPAGLLAFSLAGLLLVRASFDAVALDLSDDYEADNFGRRILAALPPHALVVSEHDETTFALWYRQASGERPDVIVVDGRLLTHGWYRSQLVRRHPDLDPAAVRPGGLTALARPVFTLVGKPAEATLRWAERRPASHPTEPTSAQFQTGTTTVTGSQSALTIVVPPEEVPQ